MSYLTREQVEEWRSVLLRRYSDGMDYKLREELNALCDMALRSPAEYERGLEDAAKMCDGWAHVPMPPGKVEMSEADLGHMQCATKLGKLIRSLKSSAVLEGK